METIKLKYRSWFKGMPPKPIKLQIPGWSGIANKHTNGDEPQPWHCPPFVEGSTYGLELIYPFDTECCVKNVDGQIIFDGDFTQESQECPKQEIEGFPPFKTFAPNHFGMTSSLDIKVPEGYVLRTEPHPRFYTDTTNTVPCCVTGHLQTSWWTKIFFVVFKNPTPGNCIIFRKNEPYAQILIVPKKVTYEIEQMSFSEVTERGLIDLKINNNLHNIIKNSWKDNLGQAFNDKYKQLAKVANNGSNAVIEFLDNAKNKRKIYLKNKFIQKKKN